MVENSTQNLEDNSSIKSTVIVDLEHTAHHGHQEYDDGIIILYRIKVNERIFDVVHRHMTGKEILALDNLSHELFKLEQVFKAEGGEKVLFHILPDVTVDFKTPGIERFITSEIPHEYEFYIGLQRHLTKSKQLTVEQILVEYAKVDPQKKTLARKINNVFHEFKDLSESLSMEDCPHFTVLDNQPVTVS